MSEVRGAFGAPQSTSTNPFRIGNGSAYVGCAFGERDARVSRLERILLTGEEPDRDGTGAFVWASRAAAEAALNRA